MKSYYPVRREQNESLDVAVIGGGVEGLLCSLALSQLDSVTVKVIDVRRSAEYRFQICMMINRSY